MTEAALMKRELDPGKVGRLLAWFEELDDREDDTVGCTYLNEFASTIQRIRSGAYSRQ